MLDAGGVIVEVLETTSIGPVSRADLDAWVNTYRLPVTTVIDPPAERVTRSYMNYGIRESMFVVDLRTGRIVNKYNGSVAGIGPSSVTAAVDRILTLLRGM